MIGCRPRKGVAQILLQQKSKQNFNGRCMGWITVPRCQSNGHPETLPQCLVTNEFSHSMPRHSLTAGNSREEQLVLGLRNSIATATMTMTATMTATLTAKGSMRSIGSWTM